MPVQLGQHWLADLLANIGQHCRHCRDLHSSHISRFQLLPTAALLLHLPRGLLRFDLRGSGHKSHSTSEVKCVHFHILRPAMKPSHAASRATQREPGRLVTVRKLLSAYLLLQVASIAVKQSPEVGQPAAALQPGSHLCTAGGQPCQLVQSVLSFCQSCFDRFQGACSPCLARAACTKCIHYAWGPGRVLTIDTSDLLMCPHNKYISSAGDARRDTQVWQQPCRSADLPRLWFMPLCWLSPAHSLCPCCCEVDDFAVPCLCQQALQLQSVLLLSQRLWCCLLCQQALQPVSCSHGPRGQVVLPQTGCSLL